MMADNNGKYYSTGNSPISLMDTRAGRGGTHPLSAVFANLQDVGTMRTYLSSYNSTTYSADRLAKMTNNDMIYAIRMINGGVR